MYIYIYIYIYILYASHVACPYASHVSCLSEQQQQTELVALLSRRLSSQLVSCLSAQAEQQASLMSLSAADLSARCCSAPRMSHVSLSSRESGCSERHERLMRDSAARMSHVSLSSSDMRATQSHVSQSLMSL
jgi:hypothetical protein